MYISYDNSKYFLIHTGKFTIFLSDFEMHKICRVLKKKPVTYKWVWVVISVCTMATIKPKQTATRGKALCVGLYKQLEYK